MLKDTPAFSGYSTNDIDKALVFYGEILGLDAHKNEMGLLELRFNSGWMTIIYPKEDHQPATFTVLNLPVQDVEATVDELTAKGVVFEKYDSEYLKTDEKGISHGDENSPTIAWFKDPAGNILSILES